MPTLTSTPSPSAFTDAATAGFRAAIEDAAGNDGRLSRREAEKLAEKGGKLDVYGASATDVLERAGQGSMSVNKAVASYRDRLSAAATDAAGTNELLSFAEGRTLPEDLQPAYLLLRGRGPVAKRERFEKAVADMLKPNGVWASSLSGHPRVELDDLPQPIVDLWDRGFLSDYMLKTTRIDVEGESAYVVDIEDPLYGGFYRYAYDAEGQRLDY